MSRKFGLMRTELYLLAIVKGCQYFNLNPTIEGLMAALSENRGVPDPLFGCEWKQPTDLLPDLNQALLILVSQGFLQVKEGERFRYYSLTEAGLQEVKDLDVPIDLMNLSAMTVFASRCGLGLSPISTTAAAA